MLWEAWQPIITKAVQKISGEGSKMATDSPRGFITSGL